MLATAICPRSLQRPSPRLSLPHAIPARPPRRRPAVLRVTSEGGSDASDSPKPKTALPYLPRLLLETPDALVFDKPPGLPFAKENGELGLMQVLRNMQQSAKLKYKGSLYPVHRLDRVTSGIVLVAKTEAAARALTRAFRARTVTKYYCAISDRRPSKKMGTVSGDMARSRRGSWKLLHTRDQAAVTHFLTCGVEDPARPGLRAFLVKPETGRTHQIRVALKALGAPILGDVRYAAAEQAEKEDRTYLHAAAVRVVLWPGAAPIQVICPPSTGAHFSCPHFRAVFASWFPPGRDRDEGPWRASPAAACAAACGHAAAQPPRIVRAYRHRPRPTALATARPPPRPFLRSGVPCNM